MRLLHLLWALLVPLVWAKVDKASWIDNKRFLELHKQASKAKDGILSIKSRNFPSVVMQNHRPYNIVLLIGANKSFCPFCETILRDYRESVTKILAAMNSDPTQKYVVASDGRPTLFAYLDASEEKLITRQLGLKFVPQLMQITPYNMECRSSDGKKVEDLSKTTTGDLCEVKSPDPLPRDSETDTEKRMVLALTKYLGLPELNEKIYPPSRRIMFSMGAVTLGILALVLSHLEQIQAFFINNQPVIAVLGLVSFTLSTSGLIYNLQHGMKWNGRDPQTGQTQWVSKQGRTQYLAEGLMFSGLTELFCLALWLAVNMIPNLRRYKGKAWVTKYGQLLKLASGLLLLVCYLSFRTLTSTILIKHPYLKPSFFPGSGFVTGSVRNDRMYGI